MECCILTYWEDHLQNDTWFRNNGNWCLTILILIKIIIKLIAYSTTSMPYALYIFTINQWWRTGPIWFRKLLLAGVFTGGLSLENSYLMGLFDFESSFWRACLQGGLILEKFISYTPIWFRKLFWVVVSAEGRICWGEGAITDFYGMLLMR